MRKTSAIFQASPRRLLSLLLIQVFVALALPHAGVSSAEPLQGLGTINKNTIIGGRPLVKTYELISRCTEHSVQMRSKKRIDALGPRRNAYTRLNFVSDVTGTIRIKSDVVKTYLCFSKKGRLISRVSGESSQCAFREVPHKQYLKLQSAANPEWYVGFNKKGHKLKGFSKRDTWGKEKCFMFTKIEWRRGSRLRHQRHFEKFKIDSTGVSLAEFDLRNR